MARQIRPGQLQENVLYNISASFAISASHEITHEVSSSYAESASFAITASHALNSGQSITPGTVSGSAQITALGFVTSSATSSFVVNSQTSSFVTNSATASFVNNSATSSFVLNSQTASFAITASDVIFANITASSNISSSGTIIGETGSYGRVDVDGDVYVSRYVRHTGDADTHIEFLDNKLQLHAGNLPFITLDKDASTPYPLTINNGGNRINFRIQDKDSNLLLKTNSEEHWTGLYFAGNRKLTTKTDGIDITGSLTLSESGHITASGNISSSGTIVASNLSGTNTGDQDLSSFITNSQTASMSVESASFAVTASHLLNNPPPFPFTGDAVITGSLVVSGSSTGIQLESPASSPGDNSIVRLGSKGTTTSNGLEIRTNSGYLQIGPQNSSYSHFYTDRGRFYFNASTYFAGNLYSVGQDFVIGRNNGTSDTIRLGDNSIEFDLNSTNMLFISSSHLISGSATSTASFGTYLGDGSQLTGIDPFPFNGDAVITGSLVVSGSGNQGGLRTNTRNIILGQGAGNNQDAINGPHNVMIGFQAGYTNTTGDSNVCIGQNAGYALGTNASDDNIFIGKLAGAGGTSPAARMSDANYNIGLGYESMLYLTSGDSNIGFGFRTMRNISSGKYNLAFGDAALYNTDTGQNNIGIGYYAGLNQTSGNGNITIGSGSLGIAGESNQLRIGHADNVIISASLDTGDIITPASITNQGTTRTLFTTASIVYSGSNVTQVTQSFGSTEQITNILYSGSFEDGNPLSIAVTGSDGINKLYTLTYSASLVTQIIQS